MASHSSTGVFASPGEPSDCQLSLQRTDRKKGGSKMGETSKLASSKHKRKEHRLTEKALARAGADRLAEAAKKREASEAAARKAAK
jgi:hypothetical protein